MRNRRSKLGLVFARSELCLIALCFLSSLLGTLASYYVPAFFTPRDENWWTHSFRSHCRRPDTVRFDKTSGAGEQSVSAGVKLRCDRIPHRLVQSLDLAPVIRLLSNHAGTRRGREAILSLIGEEEKAKRLIWQSWSSSADEYIPSHRLRAMIAGRARNTDKIEHASQSRQRLSPIATCADQARREYELVEQAKVILEGSSHDLTVPPLYGATSSPWDTETVIETDYDDWLELPLEDWTLEHVLQSEKVVETLLNVYDWGISNKTDAWRIAPGLAEIAQTIREAELVPVYQQIRGTVEIVKKRTFLDSKAMAYKFQLSEDRFPSLSLLREKEQTLCDTIENEIRTLLRKLKGSPEALEYQSRMVVLIPKSQANSELGIVRGTTDNGRRCYVEPHSCVEVGNELAFIRNELIEVEEQVQRSLMGVVHRASSTIDRSLHAVARLDVFFAKAAFGTVLNGIIPIVGNKGQISVHDFVHPVLAIRKELPSNDTVPIDLFLSNQKESQALIISGANGGGKTIALKSFGLVAAMCKLAIPIPQSSMSTSTAICHHVDFFDDIIVDVGDQQSVLGGESTLMAKLNVFSSVIDSVARNAHSETAQSRFSLVLLDELGGGTDPAAGGAIAQAVLEKLLESIHCRIVATTHSPRLKALSYNSALFHCATVLLTRDPFSDFQRPSYKLEYGSIGDSYALGAASRCSPPLPEGVLNRAASLMASSSATSAADGQAEDADYLRALTSSLERENEAARNARKTWEIKSREVGSCRSAMMKLAETYSNHWKSVEERLQEIFQKLRDDESKDAVEVIGETLETLQTVKRNVRTEEDLLEERGLRRVTPDHEFHEGESVVLISGDWEGTPATVVANDALLGSNCIAIVPTCTSWDDPFFSLEGLREYDLDTSGSSKPLIVERTEVAVWDMQSAWDDFDDTESVPVTSVREARQRLNGLLSTLNTSTEKGQEFNRRSSSQNRNFKSARQRKAARIKKKRK